MPVMPPTTPPSSPSFGARVADVVASLASRREKTNADRHLARRVFVAFERLGAAVTQGLHFYVFDGAVSVYGAVATAEVRDDVLGALTTIPGVRQVTGHLQVRTPHKPRKAFTIRPVLFDSL